MAHKVKCPSCDEMIEMDDDLDIGDVFDCPECYSELEVVSLKPPKVKECEDSFEEEENTEDDE